MLDAPREGATAVRQALEREPDERVAFVDDRPGKQRLTAESFQELAPEALDHDER